MRFDVPLNNAECCHYTNDLNGFTYVRSVSVFVDFFDDFQTNIAHYLSTGEVELSVRISPQMFYLPVMLVLMALSEKPPSKIAKMLASNHENYIEK